MLQRLGSSPLNTLMKRNYLSLVAVLLSFFGLAVSTHAQSTAFTYQGRLNAAGLPANGLFDLSFSLMDAAAGNVPRTPPSQTNTVPVTNGLFTVQLDFGYPLGPTPHWLEIGVRPGGSANPHTLLTPRQLLTFAPGAHYAINAGDVLNPVSESLIPNTIAHLGGSNRFTGPVHFEGYNSRPPQPPFTVGNSILIPGLNADLLDGLSAESFWSIEGNSGTSAGAHFIGTRDEQPLELRANFQIGLRLEPGSSSSANLLAPGDLFFGAQTRQMLNLWGAEYAIGVQADTVYFRTKSAALNFFDLFNPYPAGNFVWFAGGTHSDATFDPGPPRVLFDMPKELMRLDGSGQLTVFGTTGNGVTGKSGSAGASGVYGENNGGGFGVAGRTGTSGSAIYGDNNTSTGWAGNFNGRVFVGADLQVGGAETINGNLNFGTQTRQMMNLWGTQYGIGVQQNVLYFRCDATTLNNGFAWYKGGSHNDATLNSGGGTQLMRLNELGLWVNGTLVNGSDRNSKENLETVDTRAVLDKVAALPITAWNYKQDTSSRHLGPMAQDFRAAFGLGHDDKGIATVDADGVALAAIQGLNQKLDEQLKAKDARIEALETELSALKTLILKTKRP